jgi:nucleoside-diphosphate-sugar epimerase
MAANVLLIGCGDLGMRIARLLQARPEVGRLTALRRRPQADDAIDGLQWLAGDVTRPDTLQALPRDISHVVYTLTPGARNEAAYRAVFTEGLRNVAAALDTSRLQRFVFVSSSAVYGEHHGDWVDEDTAAAPLAYNGGVLLEAERWLAAQPFETVALRLAGIYGPGRMQLLERLRQGRAHAPRQEAQWANRIHVDDAARAASHVLLAPAAAATYVVADDTPLPLHVLYDALAELVGAPPAPDGPPPANVGSKRLSNARLRASGFAMQWPDARLGYRALLGLL